MKSVVVLLCGLLLIPGTGATAEIVVPVAYRNVGRIHGIPYKYLFAIAMQESQRELHDGSVLPWPWTLNVGGDSRYYDSPAAVREALVRLVDEGRTNIDIGLMQINLKWHGDRAHSLIDLIRPEENLNIAATILLGEYHRCGGDDWWCAVGGYHSSREKVARAYIARVRKWYEQLI